MDENQELEETTGTGRLLSLFLGMVVLCAVFFGLGYSLGKNSLSPTAQAAEPGMKALIRGVLRKAFEREGGEFPRG